MSRLLGEYLRDNCDLTCHQIVIGLRQQVIMRDAGVHTLLGNVLVALGFITEEQLAISLRRQQNDLELHQEANRPLGSDATVYLQ